MSKTPLRVKCAVCGEWSIVVTAASGRHRLVRGDAGDEALCLVCASLVRASHLAAGALESARRGGG